MSREEAAWKAAEARLRGTCLGKLKEFIFTIGIRPFFDEAMSGTLLSMSLALSPDSCSIGVIDWFLAAGVMLCFNQMLEDIRDIGV